MSEPTSETTPTLARSALTVMAALVLSQLTGLAAKMIIGKTFEPFEVDAFLAANRPSEALVFVMTGGIFVSSFIPVFVKYLVKGQHGSAWKLASATANIILLVMTFAGALLAIFARPVVTYLLTAWFPPDKQALTIDLLRIQAISIIFFSLSGLLIGILNSHKQFLLSALAPAMYQVGQILGALLFSREMGIYGLAWGVVLGSFLNLVIQIPGLIRLRGRYSLTLGRGDPAVGEVIRLMAPRMFGAAVVQLMIWVNTLLASRNEGAVYALSYGFSLMMMAQIAIAQSIATVVMPSFSAQFARGKVDEIKSTLTSVLRVELLLSLPATVGLIILSKPIITFLYQRGEFTPEVTLMVAWALIWYATGLPFHAIQEILVRAYYAMHDTRTPVICGAAAMSLSIILSLLLSSLFGHLGWMSHGGLALAVSVSTALEVAALMLILRKRLGGINGGSLLKAAGSSLLANGILIGGLLFWLEYTRTLPVYVITLGGMTAGLILYSLVLALLRVPEILAIFVGLKKRLAR